MKKIFILVLISFVFYFQYCKGKQPPKRLHTGWYTFKKLQRKGYDCTPFKGSRHIKRTTDTTLVNIKPL